MVEPIATVGFGAIAAYLGKDAIEKLLGPTADYLGQGLRDLTQKRGETIGRIFGTAHSRLGERIEGPGTVPPKVLKVILDEGSFANDRLAVEYLGGILASSRTELGRDDRGARIAKTVDAMSTYQLRTHYLIYATIRTLFAGRGLEFNAEGRPKMGIFVPYPGYFAAMDFCKAELVNLPALLAHIFHGLYTDNLLGPDWWFGGREAIEKIFAGAKEGGILCQPSSLGAELFLWAFGHSDKALEYLFSSELSATVEGLPASLEGACARQT